MKILTFSRLCLIGAIILGLLAAWSVGTPQTLSENSIAGGACADCDETGYGTCDDKPEKDCSNHYYSCDGDGSEWPGNCLEKTFCPFDLYCEPYDGGFCIH